MLSIILTCWLVSNARTTDQYDPDPNIRMQQLLNTSENLRQVRGDWHSIWKNDQPSHLTPQRVNGLISP